MQGKRSHTAMIRNGVPQGGVLSLTLFLIFINDLKESLPRKVKSSMYADDLALISTEEYVGTSKFRLQDSLDKLSQWCKDWGMTINTKKTTYSIFTLSPKQLQIKLTLEKNSFRQKRKPHISWTYLWSKTHMEKTIWKNTDQRYSKTIPDEKISWHGLGSTSQHP